MEYIEGLSLSNSLSVYEMYKRRESEKVYMKVTKQIIEAVQHLHINEVSHMNINPHNIKMRHPFLPLDQNEIVLVNLDDLCLYNPKFNLQSGNLGKKLKETIYMAHEIINPLDEMTTNKCITINSAIDVFSIGVL